MADWIGRTLSKVTIQKLIGRGGMAEVYLGVHTTLNRPVAVKILHGHLLEDDTLMARFRSEAQAVANLRHPNIIQVFDFDLADDQPYIVMELLEGPSLADHLAVLRRSHKTMIPETVSHFASVIADALDYAHSRGIVHRDVKPSNVLLRHESGSIDPKETLSEDVQPVLTDFGVARMTNATIRTASGAIVGTPAYMSPEQVSGASVDSRSDIYSLGVMLYEMLSGRLPFGREAETVASTLIKHITEPPQPLPEATPAVQAVIFRALEKKPEDRYQRAGELAFDLRVALGLPTPTKSLSPLTSHPNNALPKTVIAPAESPTRPRFRIALTIAVVMLLILAGATVVVFRAGLLDEDKGSDATGSNSSGHTMEPTFGVVMFASDEADLDRAFVYAKEMPPAPGEMQYEVWLLGGETRRSLGILEVKENGAGELEFVDSSGENLLTIYGRFEITVEPRPDSNPLPTGDVVFSGAVPPGPLVHVRHLLVSFSRTPDRIGLTIGVLHSAQRILEISQALREAQENNDLDEMKRQSEGLVNLIEGDGGEHYGDLNNDGTVTDFGDGFGLLPGARTGGYIQTSIEHARYASGTEDATAYIIDQVDKLEIAAQNLGGWTAQMRDAAMSIVDIDDIEASEEAVQQIEDLADLFMYGQDVDGNGRVEAVPDEGGAETMFNHARHMADMFVLEGANRIPEPVSMNPSPNVFPETEYDDF